MAKSTNQENGKKSGIIRVAQAIAILLGAVGTAVAAIYGATKPTGTEAEAVYHAHSKEIIALQEYAKSSTVLIQKSREECLQQSSRAEAEVAAVKTYVAGYLLGLQAGTARVQGEKREQKALDALIDAMVTKKRREGKEKVLPAPVPPDVSKLKRPTDYQSVIQQSKGG